MRNKSTARIFALSLLFLTVSSVWGFRGATAVQAQPSQARLEVWSPDVHSSNITDLALTPGSQFTVRVNVTGAGPLEAFDVTLRYNITVGPNVLQAAHPQPADPLAGGLFDPNAAYPPGCSILVARSSIDVPRGNIRFTAVVQGSCPVPGTGTLFSITFQVTGTGAGSIDILQGSNPGFFGSAIVGAPSSTLIPYVPFDAYFRNKPGIPPTPSFNFTPSNPEKGDSVQFNATQSYDPDNPSAPNNGAQTEPIVYDTNNDQVYDAGEPVIVGDTPAPGTLLGAPPPSPFCQLPYCTPDNPDLHIVFLDTNGNGQWDPGETVVYDTNENHVFDTGDFVIAGGIPDAGAMLTTDTRLTYVDSHANGFWDDGYIWDWGDGSMLSTGNVTSHIFQITSTIPAAGQFQVKLVVFDADNTLPNRQIRIVPVSLPPIHDVAVAVSLSNFVVVVGDILGIQVGLRNRGTQSETVNLTVTCSCPENITVAREPLIALPLQSLATFSYTLDTSSLSGGEYNITAQVDIIDPTTGAIIRDSTPTDNVATQLFGVLPARIKANVFFTDGNSNPLPLDSYHDPSVQAVLSNGVVRSTNPGQVLEWVNMTSTQGELLQSIRITNFLPKNWTIFSNRPDFSGAIHVYFVHSLVRTEITSSALVDVEPTRDGVELLLTIPNLSTTDAGESLQPGDSVLVSVKLRYALIGTRQDPTRFPLRYLFASFTTGWTQPSLAGSSAADFAEVLLDAYAKVSGDVNGDFKVNLADLVLVACSFGTTPTDATWNAAADLNQDGRIDLADLVEVGANFGQSS